MSARATEWWIALAVGWLCPGAGQLYARRPGRALLAAVLQAAVFIPAAIELPLMFHSPFGVALFGYALGLASLFLAPLDGAFQALTRARRPPIGWPQWARHVALAGILLVATVMVILPVLPLRRFRIPAVSMMPTLLIGDIVAADMRPVHLASLQVGDMVIFESPDQPGSLIMKRIAGLPGDSPAVRDGILVLSGVPLGSAEPASGTARETVAPGRTYAIRLIPGRSEDWPAQPVPEGHCFILGDNRMNSRDSRSFGFVPESALRGRPLSIHWSTDPDTSRTRWDRIGRSLFPTETR